MDNNLLISIIAMIGSFMGIVCGVINHKRLRSKCLSEKEMIVSLDIDNTTPPKKEEEKEEIKEDLKIKVPQSVRFNN